MADDDDKLRGTIPFEDVDILMDMDVVDGLLEEVEDGEGVLEATDPFMPALTDSTRIHAVPVELLWKSMDPEEGWMSCYAVLGRNGQLRLSAEVFERLVPGERIEVRVRRLKQPRNDR